jgi:hypothetical protein
VASLLAAAGLHLGFQALLPLAPPTTARVTGPVVLELAGLPAVAGSASEAKAATRVAAAAPPSVEKKPARSGRRTPAQAARSAATGVNVPTEAAGVVPVPVLHAAALLAAAVTEPAHPGPATDADGAAAAAAAGQGTAGSGQQGQGEAAAPPAGSPLYGPGLLSRGDPCLGYFPTSAEVASGVVRVLVAVDEGGHARAKDVLLELPVGEGFGDAARACASRLRFSPARDGRGVAVPGQAKLELRFQRKTTGHVPI